MRVARRYLDRLIFSGAIAVVCASCGLDDLEQEVFDLQVEAYESIELVPTDDDYFINSTTSDVCELSARFSDAERGTDLSKVAELARTVYPKMEPAAQDYEAEGWEVQREFTQFAPGKLPTYKFQAIKNDRRVRILVHGGAIAISTWAAPGCSGVTGFLTPIENPVDRFPELEDLLDE